MWMSLPRKIPYRPFWSCSIRDAISLVYSILVSPSLAPFISHGVRRNSCYEMASFIISMSLTLLHDSHPSPPYFPSPFPAAILEIFLSLWLAFWKESFWTPWNCRCSCAHYDRITCITWYRSFNLFGAPRPLACDAVFLPAISDTSFWADYGYHSRGTLSFTRYFCMK